MKEDEIPICHPKPHTKNTSVNASNLHVLFYHMHFFVLNS